MMNLQILRKPVPLWFSIFRFLIMVAGFAWIAYDSNFKPVAQEVANAVSEVTGLVKQVKLIDQNAIQNPSIQQPTNGAAK